MIVLIYIRVLTVGAARDDGSFSELAIPRLPNRWSRKSNQEFDYCGFVLEKSRPRSIIAVLPLFPHFGRLVHKLFESWRIRVEAKWEPTEKKESFSPP